ncbi:MAG: energy transducer TonB [Deltaproteobacteria bacterium]|nr:energy transducer TonB [Deltaproteobacteria bacterium]
MQASAATLTQIPPPLFQGRRKDGVRLYVLGLLLAVGAHSAAGVGVHRLPVSKPPVRVSMAVTKTQKPPPPPPPEEKKPEPEKPKEKPPKPEIAKAPPAPPPPNAPPPKEPPKKPVPILSGVTLESTVQGPGNFQVAVGNTLFDDPNKNKSKPTDVQRYTAPVYREAPAPPKTGGVGKDMGVFKPVPKFSVSAEPEVLREVKAPYPPDARRDGIEGVVELRVELWEDGTVRSVKVVRSLNPSLDTAAVDAMRKFLFKPATVDGVAVQYVIPRYSFRFELQG